ncbi:MAG: V-type ATP synthase subunit C [Actinomycetota bacterium]|nr:V-type ATP synthase subunit C [Actinomycetota bacterium]
MYSVLTDPMKYGFAVGRVKVRETKMLGANRLDKLIGAADFADQKRILAETDYGSFLSEATTPEDVEKGLEEYLTSLYRFLSEVDLGSNVLSYFRAKYDFQNLKMMLKESCGDKSATHLWMDLGALKLEEVKSVMARGSFEDLEEPYGSAVREAKERFDETGDYQQINVILDKAFFGHLLAAAKSTYNGFFIDFVRMSIDLVNLKVFLRAKNLKRETAFFASSLVEGGFIDKGLLILLYNEPPEALAKQIRNQPYYEVVKESISAGGFDLSLFDKRADDLLVAHLQKAKFMPIGLEALISYIIAKENEVKDLRLVLIGKQNGLPPQMIKERVRVQYV